MMRVRRAELKGEVSSMHISERSKPEVGVPNANGKIKGFGSGYGYSHNYLRDCKHCWQRIYRAARQQRLA
ncbi:hypothetical protein B0T21DRAFT_360652 [Apiosordaria backusii]|uniref:Uncharacterized protein n=1 Tax=Apiosordaria backusii TaxID=314023 RepID=A0AA40EML1_9PEZI|nr:hypothetical protein B0T21DRAFT_360652 [Apiosordaria backusii]